MSQMIYSSALSALQNYCKSLTMPSHIDALLHCTNFNTVRFSENLSPNKRITTCNKLAHIISMDTSTKFGSADLKIWQLIITDRPIRNKSHNAKKNHNFLWKTFKLNPNISTCTSTWNKKHSSISSMLIGTAISSPRCSPVLCNGAGCSAQEGQYRHNSDTDVC